MVKLIATAATVFALVGMSAIASADPWHHHDVRRLEMRLQSLRAEKRAEMHSGHRRAAARTQRQIDMVRGEIRAARH